MPCKFVFIVLAFTLITGAAGAHDYKHGTLQIDHPWTRATPKGATVAGGYMKITNTGTQPDRLIAASAPFVGDGMVHQMTMNQGVMQMRPLKDGLEIKPGETIELKPGSFHVMFMDLKIRLEQGHRVKGSLVFEKAGKIDIEYVVEAIGGEAKDGHSGH